MKKVHIGQNNKPKCVTRWSAHVVHKPSIVVPLEEFKRQQPARQCQKCAKSVDTSHFAGELGSLIFGGRSA
jgi:hypothetical protein